jgi:hypothetical protein
MSRYDYFLYGLAITSSHPLGSFAPAIAHREAAPDVVVEVAMERYRMDPRAEVVTLGPAHAGNLHRLYIHDAGYDLVYATEHASAAFCVDGRGSRVTIRVAEEFLLQDALSLLAHPVLAYVARLHGRTCLHGNVVSAGGGAVAILGRSGSGKSSLSAAMLALGCEPFADDVTALHEGVDGFAAHRGIDRLRVKPGTALGLGVDTAASSPVFRELFGNPSHDKLYLPERPDEGPRVPLLPLRGIYVLRPRTAGSSEPVIRRLDPFDALPLLAMNTSGREVLSRAARMDEHRVLSRLAGSVPVSTLECPDSLAKLGRAGEALLEELGVHHEGR